MRSSVVSFCHVSLIVSALGFVLFTAARNFSQ
jgi:hypothetical protein